MDVPNSRLDYWPVPQAIFHAAGLLQKAEGYGCKPNPEHQLIAARLCIDSRMEGVWRLLFRRHPTRHFVYPVRVEALSPVPARLETLRRRADVLKELDDPESLLEVRQLENRIKQGEDLHQKMLIQITALSPAARQEWGCAQFYLHAFASSAGAAVFTLEDLTGASKYLESKAHTIVEIAGVVSSVLENEKEMDFQSIAIALRKRAALILARKNEPLLVQRHTREDDLRAFAIKIGLVAKRLFGTPLYGTLATVANVALDREDVTLGKIRELLRSQRVCK